MNTKLIKADLLWQMNNALTRKAALLPFLAPCYLALFIYNYLGLYIMFFLRQIMRKTTTEREAYLIKVEAEIEKMNEAALFAFYSLTMTTVYWCIFGYSNDNTTLLQFSNFPTYLLGAIPYKIFVLMLAPMHIFP